MSPCTFMIRLSLLIYFISTASCTSTGHFLKGEEAFNKGNFTEAHKELAAGIKNRETVPTTMSPEEIQEQLVEARKLAYNSLTTKLKYSRDNHDYPLYSQTLKELEKTFGPVESAKHFHNEAVKSVSLAEDFKMSPDLKKKLIALQWYKSDQDKFKSRLDKIMKKIHHEHMTNARREFEVFSRTKEALAEANLALSILPDDKGTQDYIDTIQLSIKAKQSRKNLKKNLKSKKYKAAYENLTVLHQAFPKDKKIKTQLESTALKSADLTTTKGREACENASWWTCRKFIEEFKRMDIKTPDGDILLGFEKSANLEIGRELAERSVQALESGDPAMALLWSRLASKLGFPIATVLDNIEQKIEKSVREATRYKLNFNPPNITAKKAPVRNVDQLIWQKTVEKLGANNEFSEMAIITRKGADSDGTIEAQLTDFIIQRHVEKENRKKEYTDHQEKYPNPQYNEIVARLDVRGDAKDVYQKTLKQAESNAKRARSEMLAQEKEVYLNKIALQNERTLCEEIPPEQQVRAAPPPSTIDLEREVATLIDAEKDDKVVEVIKAWRAKNRVHHEEVAKIKESCRLKTWESNLSASESQLEKAKAKFEFENANFERTRDQYQAMASREFDSQIALAETPKMLTRDIKKTYTYSVQRHTVLGKLKLKLKLMDEVTRKPILSSVVAAAHSESDFSTGEIGVKSPHFEYQDIEDAHEANIGDDIEVSEKMAQDLSIKIFDEIRYGLAYQGQRFAVAAKKSTDPMTKLRNAVLVLYSNKFIANSDIETKDAKKLIESILGYRWDDNSVDFLTLSKHTSRATGPMSRL